MHVTAVKSDSAHHPEYPPVEDDRNSFHAVLEINPVTKFLKCISNSSIYIEKVAVVDVINYLELQQRILNWRLGTVKNLKPAILDLNSNWAIFIGDPFMKENIFKREDILLLQNI
ncbi:hypothetical protein AYI70_g8463 [Smittium culicis]|uniref:Uncharacterized protein n=1 Tax=Smittium culicis TaxID=133412 RepID=A0A1R1XFT3_9FUNG|nr:hypothetical protein AYI70_g8463 [Smittium culicis]